MGVSPDKTDKNMVRKIFDEALVNGESYSTLRSLCKDVGARLTGSPEADSAVRWGYRVLSEYNFDTVYLQEIIIPHWERGTVEASTLMVDGKEINIDVCALGGSVATNGLITAEVIEVNSLQQLDSLGEDNLKGKIIFYNRPMDPRYINTFKAYGACVDQRYGGASKASKYGAVAAICRSMNLTEDDHPHTGSMGYRDGVDKIPAAAMSTNSANILSNYLKSGKKCLLTLEMDCRTLKDKTSYNVIGEMKGSQHPEKIIAFGGHLDSWDKGEGAHDDGAGIAHSIEALRILKKLNYRPKYTLRCILFMNEENGNRGGQSYAKLVLDKNEIHIAALESDNGGFSPRGFRIDGEDEEVVKIEAYRELLEPYGLHIFEKGFSGVDIMPLKHSVNAIDTNMLQLGLAPDPQRYFDFHHSDADVFEVVNKRELELGCASMASMIYLIDKYF
jgi:carboxypeptidase Q